MNHPSNIAHFVYCVQQSEINILLRWCVELQPAGRPASQKQINCEYECESSFNTFIIFHSNEFRNEMSQFISKHIVCVWIEMR